LTEKILLERGCILKIKVQLICFFADYENNVVAYFHFSGIFDVLW